MASSIMDRVYRIIEAASGSAKTSEGRSRIDAIQICTAGYAEPGYDDPKSGVIAFGNWNDIGRWNEAERRFVSIDDTPCRVARLLEKLGVELEWEDEWVLCERCDKAVRCEPDSYGWKRSYWHDDNGSVACAGCINEDPAEYLESLEGDTSRCVTLDMDLGDHGYVLLQDGFEHGFYGGQDADPELIGKALREQGVGRFIFTLDGTGQFDIRFSVWVHRDDIDRLDVEAWEQAPKDGPSVVKGLRRALDDASRKMAELPDVPGHPKVARCDAGTGTARVRTVTPQEFVDGKALNF